MKTNLLMDIENEQDRQKQQWGGAKHDDGHVGMDWLTYIDKQLQYAAAATSDNYSSGRLRERLVKITALSVSAIESLDRKFNRKG